jgi:hypothetical protein
MKRAITSALLAVTLTLGCGGAAVAQLVMIHGTLDCGIWIKARDKKTSEILEGVVVGTINGLAVGRFVEIWNAGGISVSDDQAFLWLDNYCRQNPLKGVFEGLASFANERTSGGFANALRNPNKK